jgi:3-oxoacyl-[acyl-carrier protein] reductase
MRLKGKVAVITGAGGGIGAATARKFAHEGARLMLADIRAGATAAIVAEVRALGTEAESINVDLARVGDAEALIDRTLDRFGCVDILVNCAGVAKVKLFTETTREDLDRILQVNLVGAFFCAQAAARAMQSQKNGRIINITSIAGQRGGVGRSAYGASKAALDVVSRVMSTELGAHGITVNNIAPGPVSTPLLEQNIDRAQRNAYNYLIPQRRLALPEEVAAAAAFLASDEASHISGHTLNVDGGFQAAGIMYTLGPSCAPDIADFDEH